MAARRGGVYQGLDDRQARTYSVRFKCTLGANTIQTLGVGSLAIRWFLASEEELMASADDTAAVSPDGAMPTEPDPKLVDLIAQRVLQMLGDQGGDEVQLLTV